MSANILFVEDNPSLRENAALVLKLEGYTVRVARDGQEALEILDSGFQPELIVSDIMMPRMDGYQFFEAVRRKYDYLRAVPFIFLTARGSRRDITTGRLLGADDYLVKPFDPEEFLIAIQNKLRRAAEIRSLASESLSDARRLLVQLLSHELRTPLTYVTGGFALLAEELEQLEGMLPNEDIRVSLELIQGGTQRLNRLAEQAVLYAQILSGNVKERVQDSQTRQELVYLIEDALTLLNGLLSGNNIIIHRGGADDDLLPVNGIHEMLVTAISEVIRNAVQYSPPGSDITIVLERADGYVVVSVIDQGNGIPEADQATIWDVLIQSERDEHEQQGAGMGLPIVKGIVEAHGGDVHLISAPDEGTKVTLRFPLSPEA